MKPHFLFTCLLFPVILSATHILGGTILYTHLGGSSYEITLRLYRDCSSASFPNSVNVIVVDSAGNQFSPSKNINMLIDSTVNVPSYMSSCTINPGVCTQEGFYTTVVNNLPPQAGGYHLYYQYCCRTAALVNVVNPLATGMSLYTFIPDQNAVGSNSSPKWNLQPPLFECQGFPMNYDHGATDQDGDSLVYSYYTPYSDPAPTFPSNVATFTPINWVGGYSANNPCGGPNLTMNSGTGFIIGAPQSLGLFQYGVVCEEYRSGVKIAEIRRDYPFDVVVCTPGPMAAFFAPAVTCFGNTVQFQNNSLSATNYFWDFGDPTITNDTSTATNPSWLYANPGTYTVTLIADPSTACADTSTIVLTVEQVVADFSATNLVATQNTQFTDQSYSSDGAPMVWWDWNFGDATANSNSPNPVHTYANAGNYTVTLNVISANGCTATYTFTVTVQSVGIAVSELAQMNITPNPNHGQFTIGLSRSISDATVTISDVSGRCIIHQEMRNTGHLDVNEEFTAGIYFIELRSGEMTVFLKMIVQ